MCIFFGNMTDGAKSGPDCFFRHHAVSHQHLCREVVEMLFPPMCRHPQSGCGYFKREGNDVFSFPEGDLLFCLPGFAFFCAVCYRQGGVHGLLRHGNDLNLVVYPCLLCVYRYLLHIVVIDAGIVEKKNGYRLPDAHLYHANAPVPPEVVRCLAVVDAQFLLPVVVPCRVVIAKGGPGRHHPLYGGIKADIEPVFSFHKHVFYRYLVAGEHIVSLQNAGTIQKHVGMSVQAFKKDDRLVVFQLICSDGKRFFEVPVLIFHPLHLFLVGAVVRVGQYAVTNQIALYRPRHFRRIPLPER